MKIYKNDKFKSIDRETEFVNEKANQFGLLFSNKLKEIKDNLSILFGYNYVINYINQFDNKELKDLTKKEFNEIREDFIKFYTEEFGDFFNNDFNDEAQGYLFSIFEDGYDKSDNQLSLFFLAFGIDRAVKAKLNIENKFKDLYKKEIESIKEVTVKQLIPILLQINRLNNDELQSMLDEVYALSNARTDIVQETFKYNFSVAGSYNSYKRNEIKYKRWSVEPNACSRCVSNKNQGIIKFEEPFLTGNLWPPAHPNCRCDLIPVFKNDEESQ